MRHAFISKGIPGPQSTTSGSTLFPGVQLVPYGFVFRVRSFGFNNLTALFLQKHKFHPPSPVTDHPSNDSRQSAGLISVRPFFSPPFLGVSPPRRRGEFIAFTRARRSFAPHPGANGRFVSRIRPRRPLVFKEIGRFVPIKKDFFELCFPPAASPGNPSIIQSFNPSILKSSNP